jgi:TonB family protein
LNIVKRLLLAAAVVGMGLVTSAPAFASRPACDEAHGTPVLATSPNFDKPPFATQQGFIGTANVHVDLDNDGTVHEAHIFSSTGNALLDREALHVAQSLKFAPDRDACPAMAGSYSVLVNFE